MPENKEDDGDKVGTSNFDDVEGKKIQMDLMDMRINWVSFLRKKRKVKYTLTYSSDSDNLNETETSQSFEVLIESKYFSLRISKNFFMF